MNPDATEDPTNGIDDDCDGLVDEDPDDTDDTGGDQAAFRERGFGPVVPAALVFTGLGLGVAARRRRQRSDA